MFNLTNSSSSNAFEVLFGYIFNTWVQLGYCIRCINIEVSGLSASDLTSFYTDVTAVRTYPGDNVYYVHAGWLAAYYISAGVLLVAGIACIILESITVAPDVLGYASSVARNSRYVVMPKTSSAMSAGERLTRIGDTEVMMQDVRAKAQIGRIALGNKHENAYKLEKGRVYR
jgi:hypothetical protein